MGTSLQYFFSRKVKKRVLDNDYEGKGVEASLLENGSIYLIDSMLLLSINKILYHHLKKCFASFPFGSSLNFHHQQRVAHLSNHFKGTPLDIMAIVPPVH